MDANDGRVDDPRLLRLTTFLAELLVIAVYECAKSKEIVYAFERNWTSLRVHFENK